MRLTKIFATERTRVAQTRGAISIKSRAKILKRRPSFPKHHCNGIGTIVRDYLNFLLYWSKSFFAIYSRFDTTFRYWNK